LRLVIGAVLVVLGITLISNENEATGALCVVAGIAIGIRGALGPILTVTLGFVVIAVYVGYFYWMTPDLYDDGFGVWLSEHWPMFVLLVVMVIGSIIASVRNNESTWNALLADYSNNPDMAGEDFAGRVVVGLMTIDEEQLAIYVAARDVGLFIVREGDGHIFFPWDRVEKLTLPSDKPNSAIVEIKRKLMNPLILSIPWSTEMRDAVPSSVSIAGI